MPEAWGTGNAGFLKPWAAQLLAWRRQGGAFVCGAPMWTSHVLPGTHPDPGHLSTTPQHPPVWDVNSLCHR